MNKYVVLILLAAAFVGVIALRSKESEASSPEKTLKVGLQSGYPPFEFVDKEGHIVGFDVDLAHLIAKKMDKSLVIIDMEFEAEILSLKQGHIDLIISGMNITPERLKEILMVPYYGNTQKTLSLLFWNEVPSGVNSLEDLEKLPNNTLSVATGTVSESYLSHYPKLPVHTFQGSLAPLMDIKYGKSVANLVETDVAEHLAKEHPEVKIVNIPIPDAYTILGFGIGIKKDNKQLFDTVNAIIHDLKTSGELKALEVKWFQGVE